MASDSSRTRIAEIGALLDNHVDAILRDRIAVALDRGDRLPAPGTRIGPVGPVGPVGPAVPPEPPKLTPGTLGPVRLLPVKDLTPLIRRAVAADQGRVIWTSKGNEAAVQLNSLRVTTDDGIVLVGLTLETDQTGPQELTTVLAVGSDKNPAGILAVAEERPRGHGDLAATFAEAVIATAWRGVLLVVAAAAAASGRDARGDPVVPVALTATKEGLVVHTMADHRLGTKR